MSVRKIAISCVLIVIGLPLVLALIFAASASVLNQTNGSLVSSGQKREYLLHVPRKYDRARPTALVISMHGAALWPAAQMKTSQWNKVADEQGFIVVYPSGTGFPRIFPMEGTALTADVRFISDLIDTLEAGYNIDPTRIYADGFSNGGGMAFALSCTLSDRIAAVGIVAGAQLLPWSWCTDSRPVPMIAFHGTADPIVPYDGGTTWKSPTRIPFPSVRDWTASWAGRNRCGGETLESPVAAHVSRLEYAKCAGDATVVLYTVGGGGHSWPGGRPIAEWWTGPTSQEIDATSVMWAFFREHPLANKLTRP
jgi:polyhydroxybutyrate depolymerase